MKETDKKTPSKGTQKEEPPAHSVHPTQPLKVLVLRQGWRQAGTG